jgi:DNA-binding LacI/PurR family transcriptional regulator
VRFIRHPSEDTPRGHTKDAIERMILSRGYKVGDKLPTYRDLAEHFGIAVRTIERVMRHLADEGTVQLLHGKGAFVRKLPSGSGKLGEIGLVYPASRVHLIETHYLNQFLTGVIAACDFEQIDVQIVSLRATGKTTVPVPPRDIVLRVDGVILLGMLNEPYIAQFASETVPLVLADSQTLQPVHCICGDNMGAVNQVMDHLYEQGHRRIAYVGARSKDDLAKPGGPEWVDSSDSRERREAYLAALERLHLDYRQTLTSGNDDVASLDDVVDALRHDRQHPTAVLTYDDGIARGLCQALSAAGLKIPRDISVAGAVGTLAGTIIGNHLITCGILDFREMGFQAVAALRRQAAGKWALQQGVERIAVTLQAGTTSAPRRGH